MAKDEQSPVSIALGESEGAVVEIPYRYLTHHGIIAGSTGTGKSRAMQVMAEQLADAGLSVFVSDVKGDASGFCAPAFEQSEKPSETEKKWNERNKKAPFEPSAFQTNYWSVSDRFARMRFSISEIGSILFSRLLSLNPTQESHLAIAFSYAKKNGIPLDTTSQLLDVLDELVSSAQRGISPASISVIQRKAMALEESGLGRMFGRPTILIEDLLGLNVLNLSDARKDMAVAFAPAFLLQKLFDHLPEVGEVDKPEFVIFFDEAHYLFKDSNRSLRDLMATMLRQIRSKGVSVFFITQDVTDIPDEILGQLSTKIIFAQKPLTEKGNSRLRALAKSFPGESSEAQNIFETLKKLPPGTAMLSTLDDEGNQTEPVLVRMFAPATSMAVIPDGVLRKATDASIISKYAKSETTNRKAKLVPSPSLPITKKQKSESQERYVSGGQTEERTAPVKIKEVIIEKRAVKASGPAMLDSILNALLKLLQFVLKVFGMILEFILVKPLRSLFKYLTKKPIRIIYLLLFLLALYIVIVNWPIIQSFLEKLKL